MTHKAALTGVLYIVMNTNKSCENELSVLNLHFPCFILSNHLFDIPTREQHYVTGGIVNWEGRAKWFLMKALNSGKDLSKQ